MLPLPFLLIVLVALLRYCLFLKRQYSTNLDDADSKHLTTSLSCSEYKNKESPYILTKKVLVEASSKLNAEFGNGMVHSKDAVTPIADAMMNN